MPKTETPLNIAPIGTLRFQVNGLGRLTALEVTAEVNYGTFGRTATVNVWPKLTAAQQAAAQAFYDKARALVEAEFLA